MSAQWEDCKELKSKLDSTLSALRDLENLNGQSLWIRDCHNQKKGVVVPDFLNSVFITLIKAAMEKNETEFSQKLKDACYDFGKDE